MPKLDITLVPERNSTSYPEPFRAAVSGRFWRALGQAAGLTQFGVNLVRLEPGAWSSQRHWHDDEDEFLVMLSGEAVLVEDEGETLLRPGDCAAWPAGARNGHHLRNESDSDCVFVVVGSGAGGAGGYSDIDMIWTADGKFRRKDGSEF